MAENQGLLSRGWSPVGRNKRYIIWFYVLNLFLGLFGTVAFWNQTGAILDHSFSLPPAHGTTSDRRLRPHQKPVRWDHALGL